MLIHSEVKKLISNGKKKNGKEMPNMVHKINKMENVILLLTLTKMKLKYNKWWKT